MTRVFKVPFILSLTCQRFFCILRRWSRLLARSGENFTPYFAPHQIRVKKPPTHQTVVSSIPFPPGEHRRKVDLKMGDENTDCRHSQEKQYRPAEKPPANTRTPCVIRRNRALYHKGNSSIQGISEVLFFGTASRFCETAPTRRSQAPSTPKLLNALLQDSIFTNSQAEGGTNARPLPCFIRRSKRESLRAVP